MVERKAWLTWKSRGGLRQGPAWLALGLGELGRPMRRWCGDPGKSQ